MREDNLCDIIPIVVHLPTIMINYHDEEQLTIPSDQSKTIWWRYRLIYFYFYWLQLLYDLGILKHWPLNKNTSNVMAIFAPPWISANVRPSLPITTVESASSPPLVNESNLISLSSPWFAASNLLFILSGSKFLSKDAVILVIRNCDGIFEHILLITSVAYDRQGVF